MLELTKEGGLGFCVWQQCWRRPSCCLWRDNLGLLEAFTVENSEIPCPIDFPAWILENYHFDCISWFFDTETIFHLQTDILSEKVWGSGEVFTSSQHARLVCKGASFSLFLSSFSEQERCLQANNKEFNSTFGYPVSIRSLAVSEGGWNSLIFPLLVGQELHCRCRSYNLSSTFPHTPIQWGLVQWRLRTKINPVT